MESVSLEMDDIFEDQIRGEDEEQLPEMLPDLPEGLESEIQPTQNDEEAENQEVLAKLKGMKGASKNTVKRSMPKLDGTRLTGERGIPILPHVFKDVKLKGKGHEVGDMRVVMRYLEHWAHRLFPMMPFDKVLERIERLGTKRDVQTCIKKMRMDMPVLGSDTVSRGDDDGEGERDGDQESNERQNPKAEDLFDAMIRDEQELLADTQGVSKTTNSQTTSGVAATSSTSSGQLTQGLSSEVFERMERNRRMAMERRAKKLGVSLPADAPSHQGSSHPSASQSQGSADTLSKTQDKAEETSNSQPQNQGDQAASHSITP
ncbi:TIMELESS-interacting protein-like [Littorina saxatilis]|uniref:TIMELESS-interacting protein n=1 Tax=Littorina saxatilis TaxID=31220 RepID=A0AAN9GP29_9CAEN